MDFFQVDRFGELYPVLFPDQTISRKQHVIIFVLPKFLLKGTCYKFMKIEQMCEYLHCLYNSLENTRRTQKNRGLRFLQCIRAHENKMSTDREKILKRLKN